MEKTKMVGEEEVTGISISNDLQEGAGETDPLRLKDNFRERPYRRGQSWVYFIRSGDAIKIGYSMDPLGRLASLQTGTAQKLELLGTIRGAKKNERDLHKLFAHLRRRGEWFRAAPELLKYIDRAMGRVKPVPPREPPPPPLSAEARAMVANLIGIRVAHGAKTPIGYRCSNLAEMIPNYLNSTDPVQRAHLAASMTKQMADLKRLKAQLN